MTELRGEINPPMERFPVRSSIISRNRTGPTVVTEGTANSTKVAQGLTTRENWKPQDDRHAKIGATINPLIPIIRRHKLVRVVSNLEISGIHGPTSWQSWIFEQYFLDKANKGLERYQLPWLARSINQVGYTPRAIRTSLGMGVVEDGYKGQKARQPCWIHRDFLPTDIRGLWGDFDRLSIDV